MIYLNEDSIKSIGISWEATIQVIRNTLKIIHNKDFSQPIKPYLRYGNPDNRIIAMPAFLGGHIQTAGLKWIASFPRNIELGIARAHSVTILNEGNTGIPICIINTPLISIIRTVSVSGVLLEEYLKRKEKVSIGIIGFGPIGKNHADMCVSLFKEKLSSLYIYDKVMKKDDSFYQNVNCQFVDTWEKVYLNSDVVITCTTSAHRYINLAPREKAICLNISLRDYCINTFDYFKDSIIVDSWEEVCRENTDIENYHLNKGLDKSHVFSLDDVIVNQRLDEISTPIMFNPMGMGVFDISIAHYYYKKSIKNKIGRNE